MCFLGIILFLFSFKVIRPSNNVRVEIKNYIPIVLSPSGHNVLLQTTHVIMILFYGTLIKCFTVNTELTEMAVLASKGLTTPKKLPSVGLGLLQEIITRLGVQCLAS